MTRATPLSLLFATALCATSVAASPIVTGELILNGDFGVPSAPSLADWTTSGGASARGPSDVINTAGGSAGFNGYFDSAFAVVGDNGGDITAQPQNGTHSLSQLVTLGAEIGGIPVASYDISISFRTVFDGDDSSLTDAQWKDRFSASFGSILLFSQDSTPLADCNPSSGCPNLQLTQSPFSVTLLGLAPGGYLLTFVLEESGGSNDKLTNTAAGIDGVSVSGLALPVSADRGSPAAVPEPASALLAGLGLVGLAAFRRRR